MVVVVQHPSSFPYFTDPSLCSAVEGERQHPPPKTDDNLSCSISGKCVNGCAAYGKVCPYAAQIASRAAQDAIDALSKDSKIFLNHGKQRFVTFDPEDIRMGYKLGEGGFSKVNTCVINSGPEQGQELAIKFLKLKTMVDPHQFKHGAADLAVEAQ